MSKIFILGTEKEYIDLLKEMLIDQNIDTLVPARIIPNEYCELSSIELMPNFDLSYHLTNIFSIKNGNVEKKEFTNIFDIFKQFLYFNETKILLCLQWIGNDTDDLNELFEYKYINLYDYIFPEDEFEFEFNTIYELYYEEK